MEELSFSDRIKILEIANSKSSTMKRIVIYFGNPDTCPPCRQFQGDWQKLEPVFKLHEIVFVNGSGDLRSLPISDEFFRKSREVMNKIQRIPQFHFFEVEGEEIKKYKSEVGYDGVFRFVNTMSAIFGLTNNITTSTIYRKKAEYANAIQFNGNSNRSEVEKFVGKELKAELESETAYLAGEGAPIFSLWLPGDGPIHRGDWVVKNSNGNYSIMNSNEFGLMYEAV
jgi:hypothetical protein